MSPALQLFVAQSGIEVMGPFPWSCSLTTLVWASTNLPSLANMEHKMTYKSLSLFLVVETTAKQDASPWVSRYCKQAKKQASLTLPKGYLRRNRDCSKASRCFQIFSGSSRIQCQWSRSKENNHRVMKYITMSTKTKILILDMTCANWDFLGPKFSVYYWSITGFTKQNHVYKYSAGWIKSTSAVTPKKTITRSKDKNNINVVLTRIAYDRNP